VEEYDMNLIRDFTSRCVPLHEYEFAGDFDKRTGGGEYEPRAFSYIVAMNRETKQTFGDMINILRFQNHERYIRWCNENPAEYRREKEEYKSCYPHYSPDKNERDFECWLEDLMFNSPKLYRRNCNISCKAYEIILKFSELSQDPQDLLQKCTSNGFQDQHQMVELRNIEEMLIKNGYKYPEKFFPSIFSRFAQVTDDDSMFEGFEEEYYIPIVEKMFSKANSDASIFSKL
jgi:hypothetical protein